MILSTDREHEWTINVGPSRALFLLADQRGCDLESIVQQISPGLFDEVYLIDCGADVSVRQEAERLGLSCITFPAEFQPGRMRKFCFDFARSQGLQLAVMFEVAHARDLSSLPPLVRLLDDEAWDVILGSRFEHRAEASLKKDSFKRSMLSRWQRVLGSLFFGRQIQDTGSDFLACRTHLLWKLPYHEYQDGALFDWEFLSQVLVAGYRVGEIPVPLEVNSSEAKVAVTQSMRHLVDAFGITFRQSLVAMFPTVMAYFRR